MRQWDSGFAIDMFNDCNLTIEEVDNLPKSNRAIIVIPARHHAGLEEDINKQLERINKPILFLLGDEEADFDVDAIKLDPKRIWIQNPHIGKHDKYNKLGTGYPQHMKQNLPQTITKTLNMFFAGQITHERRHDLLNNMLDYELHDKNTEIIKTKGFTQGIKPDQYYAKMCSAKIAPAPSGAVIPDSFRLFEALECMAIPIADQKTPSGQIMEYWDWLFQQITPFPKVDNWASIKDITPELLDDYYNISHKITAWYIKYKRDLRYKLLEVYYE